MEKRKSGANLIKLGSICLRKFKSSHLQLLPEHHSVLFQSIYLWHTCAKRNRDRLESSLVCKTTILIKITKSGNRYCNYICCTRMGFHQDSCRNSWFSHDDSLIVTVCVRCVSYKLLWLATYWIWLNNISTETLPIYFTIHNSYILSSRKNMKKPRVA